LQIIYDIIFVELRLLGFLRNSWGLYMDIIQQIINLIRFCRKLYWRKILKNCGENFVCCSGVKIHGARYTSVGNDVRIGEKSYIQAKGGLTIGDNVKIGPQVLIWTSYHNYYAPEKLPYDHKEINRPVTINDNVWIGTRAAIIPGVTIGEGAVIGMCSVVTKDVPPCAVVGGNPAKVLKYRDIEVYNKLSSKNIAIETHHTQC